MDRLTAVRKKGPKEILLYVVSHVLTEGNNKVPEKHDVDHGTNPENQLDRGTLHAAELWFADFKF